MEPYSKIESLLVRDVETFKVIPGQWRIPEFEYLAENPWIVTEKVDGTNVRVGWDGDKVEFGGRTDNAQMPTRLIACLTELFPASKFSDPMTLYGEGYGAGIQKGGDYGEEQKFILFDVRVGGWWLRWDDVCGIADSLDIAVVPTWPNLTLVDVVSGIENESFMSQLKSGTPEGVVVRPLVPLCTRSGHRLIGKLKGIDFVSGRK